MILFIKNLTADAITLNDGDNNQILYLWPAGTVAAGTTNPIDRGAISDVNAARQEVQRLIAQSKLALYTDSAYSSPASGIPGPSVGSIASTGITDATTVGRNVLTAASTAAAQTAIGLANASTSAVGLVQLGTDLGTSPTAPTVVGVHGTVTTATPTAGGASALPATPAGYVSILVNGVAQKVAYY